MSSVAFESYCDIDTSYALREEARKSWDHAVSDKIVYLLNPREVARQIKSRVGRKIAKNYLNGDAWIEAHLTFKRDGNAEHLLLVIEFEGFDKFGRSLAGKGKFSALSMDGILRCLSILQSLLSRDRRWRKGSALLYG